MNIFDQFSAPGSHKIASGCNKVTNECMTSGNIVTNMEPVNTMSELTMASSDVVVQLVDEDGNPIEGVNLSSVMDMMEVVEHVETLQPEFTDKLLHLIDHTYCIPADMIRISPQKSQEKGLTSTLGSVHNLPGGTSGKKTQGPLPAAVMNQTDAVTELNRLHSKGRSYSAVGQQTLNRHKSTHMGKFMCHLCGKILGLESSLAQHVAAHTGEKRFNCEICGQVFLDEGSMMIHLSKHAECPLVVCHLCDKVIPGKGALQRHLQEVHTLHSRRSYFTCPICSVKFRYKIACIKHMSRMHKIHVEDTDVSGNSCRQMEGSSFDDASLTGADIVLRVRRMERKRKLVVSVEQLDLETMRGLYLDPPTIKTCLSGGASVNLADNSTSRQTEPVKEKCASSASLSCPSGVVNDFHISAYTNERRQSHILSINSLDSAVHFAEKNKTNFSQNAQNVVQNCKQIFSASDKQNKSTENSGNFPVTMVTKNVNALPPVCVQRKNIFDDFDTGCQNVNPVKLPNEQRVILQVNKDIKLNCQMRTDKVPLASSIAESDESVDLIPGKRFRNIFDDFVSDNKHKQAELKSQQTVDWRNKSAVTSKEVKGHQIAVKSQEFKDDRLTVNISSPIISNKPESLNLSHVNISNIDSAALTKSDSSSQNAHQNAVSSTKNEQSETLSQRPKRIRVKKADSDFVYYGEFGSGVVGRPILDVPREEAAVNELEKSSVESKLKSQRSDSVSESKPEIRSLDGQTKSFSSPGISIKNKNFEKIGDESKLRNVAKVEQKTLNNGNSAVAVGNLIHSSPSMTGSSLPPAVKCGFAFNGVGNKAIQIVVNDQGVPVAGIAGAKSDQVSTKKKMKIEPKENIDIVNSKRLQQKSCLTSPAGIKNGRLTPNKENSKIRMSDLPKMSGKPKSKQKQEMTTPKSVPKGRGRPKNPKSTSKTKSKYTKHDEELEDEIFEENESRVSERRSDDEDESSEEEEEVEPEVVYFSHDPRTGEMTFTSDPNNKTPHGNTLVNIDLNKGEMAKGDIFINPDVPDVEYVLVDGNCLLPLTMFEPVESSVIRIDSTAEWNGHILC